MNVNPFERDFGKKINQMQLRLYKLEKLVRRLSSGGELVINSTDDGSSSSSGSSSPDIEETAWRDVVEDKDLTAPPGGESTGDRYIVGASATGDWSGQDNNIAEYGADGVYTFTTPTEGYAVYVKDEDSVYIYDGSNWLNITALNAMARIGASTYYSIQHLQDIFHSAGYSSGGTISDAGGATVDVAAGTGFIRATDSGVAEIKFFDWSAVSGQAITADSIRYIGVEYNGGSPQVVIRTAYDWDFRTDFPLGNVVNEGGTLHITNAPHAVGDHASLMIQRMYGAMGIQRDNRSGGLILGDSTGRYVTVSAGTLWERLQPFTIAAIDTNPGGGADTFDRYYTDGLGGWNKQSAQTQWDNTQYDNSGTLTTMTNNRYKCEYYYLELDGTLVAVYGQAEYVSEANAEAEAPPSSLPNRLQASAILIGRFIIQKSGSTVIVTESAFDTAFDAASVTSHDQLSGLSDDDHTQYVLVDGTRAMTGDLNMGSQDITNLGNVYGASIGIISNQNVGVDIDTDNNQTDRSFFVRKNNSTIVFQVHETNGIVASDNLDMQGNDILLDDNAEIQLGTGNDLKAYSDGTNGHLETPAGITIDAASFVRIRDVGDSYVTLLDFDVNATGGRSLTIGAAADNVATTMEGTLTIANQGAGLDVVLSSNDTGKTLNVSNVLLIENQGAGADPRLYSSSTAQLMTVDSQLAIENQGAGADPVLSSNSANNELTITTDRVQIGDFRILENLTSVSYIGSTANIPMVLQTNGTNAVTIDTTQGTKIHNNIGFYGATPVAQGAAWTITNVTTDRTYDANSTTVAELADALGTLIAELQSNGLLA